VQRSEARTRKRAVGTGYSKRPIVITLAACL